MNILYTSDNNYARILAVSIYSLLETNGQHEVNVYILASYISKGKKKQITSLFTNPKHHVTWFDVKPEVEYAVTADRGSVAQFSRLFFDRYLPQEVQRILYLDCDTLIMDNLAELYQMDFENYVALMAKDPFSKIYRRALNLPQYAEMYNSGIMLLNRKKYHQKNYFQRCLDVIAEQGKKIIQGDQGVLDIVLQNDVKPLDPRFNVISSYFEFSYDELRHYRHMTKFYSKQELEQAIQAPVIVHFTSDFLDNRPWLGCLDHPYARTWLTLEEKIFGKNELWESSSKLRKVFYFLPRQLAIRVFGLLQGYIRPWLYQLKR